MTDEPAHVAKGALAYRAERDRRPPEKPKPNGVDHDAPLATVQIGALASVPIPERQFLDGHGFMPMGCAHVLNGDGAIGKTYLACQLAAACQSGTQWLGMPIGQGPVIMFSAEEPLEELRRRFHAICLAEDIDIAELHEVHIIDRRGNQPG